jgi:hypothetical protein
LNVPWTTHRVIAQGCTAAEAPSKLREFMALREQADANRKAGVRYSSREAERFLGRPGTRQIIREDLVPEVARGLADMTSAERRAVLQNVSVAQKQEMLRDLVAQPEVLDPVVNDRTTPGGVSDAESAFFRARAPYLTDQHLEIERNRQVTRDVLLEGMLNSPSLTNKVFLGQMDNRVRNDWTRYQALARDLAEPVLQQWAEQLAFSRIHFEYLKQAVQACIDQLPAAVVPVTGVDGEGQTVGAERDESGFIDTEASEMVREVARRFNMLPEVTDDAA